MKTIAVGHPIADGLNKYKHDKNTNDKIIALVPGSRMNEVKKLLPVFHKTINMLIDCGYRNYKFVIPTVETTDAYIRENVKNWEHKPEIINSDKRYELYANTYIAIVASGTVSAELAIMHIPTIVVYKMNPLTVLLARILLRVKWASLVNILMNKTIFPELLGRKANAMSIMNELQQLTLPSVRNQMINDLTDADNLWLKNGKNPAQTIATDILKN